LRTTISVASAIYDIFKRKLSTENSSSGSSADSNEADGVGAKMTQVGGN